MEGELWKRIPLNSNYAAAYGAKDSNVDVVAAYPITPQTPVVEKIAEFIANGELDAEMIHVESEHSAMSACIGAAAAGARTFTATSAQGLELMHELLHIASGLRLPIVMSIASRALSAPLSIWGDYSDVINVRDTSWIILMTSTAQEVYDSIIQAYKIAENPDVLLPVIVAYDGFMMSHTYEPVYVASNPEIFRDYIPKKISWTTLNVEKPITMGAVANPDWYYEFKYQQVVAMKKSYEIVKDAAKEFGKRYGRFYDTIETYNYGNSKIGILTYGGLFGTVMEAVDRMNKQGMQIAGIKLRLFRPFPSQDIKSILEDLKVLIVIDRAISYGAPIEGSVAMELSALMYRESLDIPIYSYIASIGQRTTTEEDIIGIVKDAINLFERGKRVTESIYWGVRE